MQIKANLLTADTCLQRMTVHFTCSACMYPIFKNTQSMPLKLGK